MSDIRFVVAVLFVLIFGTAFALVIYFSRAEGRTPSAAVRASFARARTQLNVVLFVSGTVAAPLVRLLGGAGWWFLLLGVPYVILLIIHMVVGILALRSPLRSSPAIALAIAAFVLAFLLQWDVGDGYAWLAVTGFLRGAGEESAKPPFMLDFGEDTGPLYDIFLFIPAAAMWWYLLRQRAALRVRPN